MPEKGAFKAGMQLYGLLLSLSYRQMQDGKLALLFAWQLADGCVGRQTQFWDGVGPGSERCNANRSGVQKQRRKAKYAMLKCSFRSWHPNADLAWSMRLQARPLP